MSGPDPSPEGDRRRITLRAGLADADLLEVRRELTGAVRAVVLEGRWDGGPHTPDALSWLQDPDLLSVAALSGEVADTGLALACDLRVAADGTVLRLDPLSQGSGVLVAAVGLARATAWCLTRAEVTAGEALAAGLLVAVVPEAELHEAADRLVAQVLARPRAEVVEGKALLRGAVRRTSHEQWKAEADARRRSLEEE